MDLTQEDVLHILKIMDESDYGNLHLEVGELKLIVNKRGVSGFFQDEKGASPPGSTVVFDHVKKAIQPDFPVKIENKTEAGNRDEEYAAEGLIPIRSPMLGTFYSSSSTGSAPFVEAGQVVNEETTVCIIEVMKLFTTIHAGIQGRIAKICANDGQMVV